MTCCRLLDDGPKIPVLSVEPAFILRDETFEVMEKHPVEDGLVGLARTVDPGHGKEDESRNRPEETSGAPSP